MDIPERKILSSTDHHTPSAKQNITNAEFFPVWSRKSTAPSDFMDVLLE